MTVPDPTAPTAEDVIARVFHRALGCWGECTPGDEDRQHAAAVVAAIRGMSPETLAELIGGELVDRVIFGGRRIRYVCSPPEYEDPS